MRLLRTSFKKLSCPVIEISALKGEGIQEAAEASIAAARAERKEPAHIAHIFSGAVEHAIAHIEEAAVHNMPEEQQRWYAIKIFERDERVIKQLELSGVKLLGIVMNQSDSENTIYGRYRRSRY